MSSPLQTCLPLRVYYEDTDAGGVVYYAHYLKFLERGRTEMLREAGFSQSELAGVHQRLFVVRSVSAQYLKPAVLDDALEVKTCLEKIGRASLVFEQRVERAGAVLMTATVTVASIDAHSRKPAALPGVVRERLLGASSDPSLYPAFFNPPWSGS